MEHLDTVHGDQNEAVGLPYGAENQKLPEVCDCAALSRFLHVDIKTVQGLAQRREIPCRKVGKAYRFFRPAVLAWLCDQTDSADATKRHR
jgi:hypothetical protein